MSETQKPRRRWFQYSLRSLFLVTFLASLGMSWFAVRMKRAREQNAAVEEIKRLGGAVLYDYQAKMAGPPEPAWLRNLLGEDFFATVVEAHVFVDTASAHLKGLRQLQTLELVNVTDAGLENLKGLRQLQYLQINRRTLPMLALSI